MIILFQNILFSKEFLVCNGCFGLFTIIKKRNGTSFWCTSSAWFFNKNVLFYLIILYQLTKFQCHNFFPSPDIKQNVLLSSYLDTWCVINFEIYLGSTSKAMADWVKKRGEDQNTKIGISWEPKELFRWNKKHFS